MTSWETAGERIPFLVSLGGKHQVVKRGGKLEKGHRVRLANPILIPVTHLGNEKQLVDRESKTGKQVKVCLVFASVVSHYSIIHVYFSWLLTVSKYSDSNHRCFHISYRLMWPIS